MKINLYLVRQGQTMFNLHSRIEGWSDSPLTQAGELQMKHLGIGLQEIPFKRAYSSGSGRAVSSCKIILNEQREHNFLTQEIDPRLREWCFGTYEGTPSSLFWDIVLKILDIDSVEDIYNKKLSFKQVIDTIYYMDTAGWAETYDQLRDRIYNAFLEIAKTQQHHYGGDVLILSHGFTIAFLLNLIDSSQSFQGSVKRGAITKLEFKNNSFIIRSINDLSFLKRGEELAK